MSPCGYVYVLFYSCKCSSLYKIGYARKLLRRLNSISQTLPHDAWILGYILAEDYKVVEARLHRRFKSRRGKNDWFNLNRQDVEYIIGLQNFVLVNKKLDSKSYGEINSSMGLRGQPAKIFPLLSASREVGKE